MTFNSTSLFARSFNNDFTDLFNNEKLVPMSKLTIITTVSSQMNEYCSCDWKYEDTYKYVFSGANGVYEAGYYVHYDENKQIKDMTIELATSYGCPFKCKYCASSSINKFHIAEEDTILEILKTIYFTHNLNFADNIHITFTGTGDFYYTEKLLNGIIPKIKKIYTGSYYTFSSCAWNDELVKKVERMSLGGYIKNLQISFLSCDVNKIKQVITNYIDRCSIDELIKIIDNASSSLRDKFRINYIMIKDFNDSDQDFDDFINKFITLKDIIKVRISKLNKTNCSEKNSLSSPDDSRLQEMEKRCKNAGFNAYIFSSKVNDNLNCGQLITEIK